MRPARPLRCETRRVEGLPQGVGDGGRQPVPEQLVLADDCGVGLVPVAVDGDEAFARPVAVSVVASVPVDHVYLLLCGVFL